MRLPKRTLLALSVAAAIPLARAADEPAAGPKVDYAYFKERVQPIVLRVCAECHANPRKRLGKHFLRPMPGRTVRERDTQANFEMVQKLIVPGNASASLWLLKPLGSRQGGIDHKGGEKVRFDSLEYATMVDFINGARLERPTATPDAERARPAPEVGNDGLVLEAEDFDVEGDAKEQEDPQAHGLAVVPGEGGATLEHLFVAPEARTYSLAFRAKGPARFAFRLDEGAEVDGAVPKEGWQDVTPGILCDGSEPLVGPRGALAIEGGALAMHGASDAPAAWLSPAAVEHDVVEATFEPASEDDGGDDALLLFDMADAANGKYTGLVDGGRKVVMGLVEGGKLRALASKAATPATGPRKLRVQYLPGVAVLRLDGAAVLSVNFDRLLGSGRFGALTHGAMTVAGISAFAQFEVHKVKFVELPAFRLEPGRHRLVVELPAGGPALDRVVLKVSAP